MRTNLRELPTYGGVGAQALRALDRDARAPRLLDIPVAKAIDQEGAEGSAGGGSMRALRVIVVGLGSVGSYFADLLARSTVASLLLVDRAHFKPESVLTHPVHPHDLGRPKATVAGERAKAVSPSTRVEVFDGPVEELGLDAFVDSDAVLLASDNLACELEVSRRCLFLGVPLIQASVHGPTLVAQVRSLGNPPHSSEGGGPCLACGFQAADWVALDRGTVFSCAGGPARRNGIPTVSPAELCSLAASLGVTELLGRTVGLVPASTSRLIEYCGFTHRTSVTPLDRRAACPLDHETWRVVRWEGRLASATPRALFAAAGVTLGTGSLGTGSASAGSGCNAEDALQGVSMTVAGYRFSGKGLCACPEPPPLERFRSMHHESMKNGDAPCAACGTPLEPHPFHTHEVVPGTALRDHLDRALGKLGADTPRTVLVRRDEQACLFHAQPFHAQPCHAQQQVSA